MIAAGNKNNGRDDKRIYNYLSIGKRIQVFFLAKPDKINQRQAKDGAGNFVKGQKRWGPLAGQSAI